MKSIHAVKDIKTLFADSLACSKDFNTDYCSWAQTVLLFIKLDCGRIGNGKV
jgi:hypothetical protein